MPRTEIPFELMAACVNLLKLYPEYVFPEKYQRMNRVTRVLYILIKEKELSTKRQLLIEDFK